MTFPNRQTAALGDRVKTLIGHRFQKFTEPGSMGVVTDTRRRFPPAWWLGPDVPLGLALWALIVWAVVHAG